MPGPGAPVPGGAAIPGPPAMRQNFPIQQQQQQQLQHPPQPATQQQLAQPQQQQLYGHEPGIKRIFKNGKMCFLANAVDFFLYLFCRS